MSSRVCSGYRTRILVCDFRAHLVVWKERKARLAIALLTAGGEEWVENCGVEL